MRGNAGVRRKKSIKTRVFAVLLVMQVPLILMILIYNVYFVNFYNSKISESNRNALKSYCDVLEDHLERLNSRLVNFIAMDSDFKFLSAEEDYLDAHVQSLHILDTFKILIEENQLLYGCYIVNREHEIFREAYGSTGVDYETNTALRDYFWSYTDTRERLTDMVWKPLVQNGKSFLFMVKGYKGTYCVYLVDVGKIHFPQDDAESGQAGEIFLLGGDGAEVLNPQEKLTDNAVVFNGKDSYYFSGNPQRFMIIEKPVVLSDIRAAYVMRYKGFLGSLSFAQKVVMFISILVAVLLIPVGYHLLKKVFFRPVDALVETMNAIRGGRLETRADENYGETEFLEVNNTFNTMIGEIKNLKIEAYEKELSLRQTQLDYFQIQIRPHFYVNCLKSIYGLLEEKRYEDTKRSIVFLSRHLRYMLKGASMIVPVAEELSYVSNYIELQQISMAYPPECSIEIEEALNRQQIPAISILSFVENSIKYGMEQGKILKIHVQVQRMVSEDGVYMNIHISDNGTGFDEAQLLSLNNYEKPEKNGRSIGIYNVIQRFMLYYGEDKVLFGFSNMGGAHVDIFIQESETAPENTLEAEG